MGGLAGRTISRWGAPVVALVALASGACGRPSQDQAVQAGTPAEALTFLQQSADKTLGTDTYKVTSEMSVNTAPSGGNCGSGAPLPGPSVSRVRGSDGTIEADSDGDGNVDMVLRDTSLWIARTALPGAPSGTPWIGFDESEALALMYLLPAEHMNAAVPTFPSFAMRPDSALDPKASLDSLRKSAATVGNQGREPVDGVDTTHLTITLDQAKYDASVREALEKPPTGDTSGTTMPPLPDGFTFPVPTVDAWIDDEGLVRRIRERVVYDAADTPTPSGTLPAELEQLLSSTTSTTPPEPMTWETTSTFSEYGVPLSVGVPPADQTAPVGTLPASMMHGFTLGRCATSPPDLPQSMQQYDACVQQGIAASTAGRTIDQVIQEVGGADKLVDLQNVIGCNIEGTVPGPPSDGATPMPEDLETCATGMPESQSGSTSAAPLDVTDVPDDCLPVICPFLGIMDEVPAEAYPPDVTPADVATLKARCTAAGIAMDAPWTTVAPGDIPIPLPSVPPPGPPGSTPH